MSVINQSHRESPLGRISVLHLLMEGNYDKFELTPQNGQCHFGHYMAMTALMFLICATAALVWAVTIGKFPNPAIGFGWVALTITIMVEIMSPVPYRAINDLIRNVQLQERKNGLVATEGWWLYVHYFVLRNHPLLNTWKVLIRISVITIPVIGAMIVYPVLNTGMFATIILMYYTSWKFTYLTE